MTDLFQFITTKITTIITVIIITISGIFPRPTADINKPVDTFTATPSAIVLASPTPLVSITPTTTPKPKIKVENIPTTTPVINEAFLENTQDTNEIQKPKTDPSVGIEICRTKSSEERARYEQIADDVLKKEQPGIYELANTSNNEQTEQIALKYGYIKQSDIVRSAEVYQKLINEGRPSDFARSIAESSANTWWTYLRGLHDWGVTEMNNFKSKIDTKADTYENQVYQGCLSAL